MKKMLAFVLILATGLAAQAQPPKVPANPGAVFGVKTTAENAIPADDVVAVLKEKKGPVDVKIRGTVTAVCQMMGCWIKIKTANGDMTVKMKDEKFFVPAALDGKSVVIDGTAEQKLTSVEDLRHEAEDGGKSKAEIAKISVPKKEIVVQAKGILVL